MSEYSWSDMANALSDFNIPRQVIAELHSVELSMILHRPVFDIFKFDDYLHSVYGKYEREGKSMRDMFRKLFGDRAEEIEKYFGVP